MPADVLASTHLHALCEVSPDRRPGSPGNEQAAGYVAQEWRHLRWDVSDQRFDVLDWSGSAGSVTLGRQRWTVHPSPYAHGAEMSRPLLVLRTRDDLDTAAASGGLRGRAVLLMDELSREQLTPLGYPFYANPDHAAILDVLMQARPSVVLAGTGTAPQTAGAMEPFPLIEDGTFPIPTGNLGLSDAAALARHDGERVRVDMSAHRWPSTARNVIARRGPRSPRLLVTAHLDSKPGTPGAVDNASGVTVLLLLARALADQTLDAVGVELLAVNGEDCYSAAGELAYLDEYGPSLDEVHLVANVDGVGFRVGGTAYSTYELPAVLEEPVRRAVTGPAAHDAHLLEGPAWLASDHAVFVARGRPAVAFTSERLDTVLTEVAHSPHDTPAQVEPTLLDGLSRVLADLALGLQRP